MGVSISKSTVYTDMKKKAKQRAASKSKEGLPKNSVKGVIEGKHLLKDDPKSTRNQPPSKDLHTKHPIESLALSSNKNSETNAYI